MFDFLASLIDIAIASILYVVFGLVIIALFIIAIPFIVACAPFALIYYLVTGGNNP